MRSVDVSSLHAAATPRSRVPAIMPNGLCFCEPRHTAKAAVDVNQGRVSLREVGNGDAFAQRVHGQVCQSSMHVNGAELSGERAAEVAFASAVVRPAEREQGGPQWSQRLPAAHVARRCHEL